MPKQVHIIGGGPAGLIAAQTIATLNPSIKIALFDAKPSVGRKFLIAGRSGLNITHSEPLEAFLQKYGSRQQVLQPLIEKFGPSQIQAWMTTLGIDSFKGSSGKVFPLEMKAAPLLRAWLLHLRAKNVQFHVRHEWQTWNHAEQHKIRSTFHTKDGVISEEAEATIIALGGASWPQLGSNGNWVHAFEQQGVKIAPLEASNCGFNCQWSPFLLEKFAGSIAKSIKATVVDTEGFEHSKKGDLTISGYGIEGSVVYALSPPLRKLISTHGNASIFVDLLPDHDYSRVLAATSKSRGTKSLSAHLKSTLGLAGIKSALLHECVNRTIFADPTLLAQSIKRLPIRLTSSRPIHEAISTAGGVQFEELDGNLMLRSHPGVFCAGEMLDWDAPTGGYLLTACFATGVAAATGAVNYLKRFD